MSENQIPRDVKAIDGISLASFLQLLEQERKSCTLVVKQGKQSAQLYFNEGNLVDAEHANNHGLEAAYTILAWEDATFYLADAEQRNRRIIQPLAQIILTASTISDEQKDLRKSQNTSSPQHTTPAKMSSTLSAITQKLLAIPGVKHYYLLNRQGKMIVQSCQNQKMCDFIAYCIVSGIQMREALGAKSLHNIRIRLNDDTVLLIVPASGAIIGLLLGSEVNVADIYPQLRKVLTKKQ